MEDETRFLILHGCKLARDLESNLPKLTDRHDHRTTNATARTCCEEIIRIFAAVLQKPLFHISEYPVSMDLSDHLRLGYKRTSCLLPLEGDHWWGSSSGRDEVVDLPAPPAPPAATQKKRTRDRLAVDKGKTGPDRQRSYEAVDCGIKMFRGLGGRVSSMEAPDVPPRSASPNMQRTRRRSRVDEGEKREMRVAAPQIGNTDIPPDDGYTWRKYGQKTILGSVHPRGYYRCTHQKLYGCPAKKHVQRLDEDYYTFKVIYRGEHTCHKSSTAPVFPPLPPSDPADTAPSFATSSSGHQPQTSMTMQSPPPPSISSWVPENLRVPGERPNRGYNKEACVEYAVAGTVDIMFGSHGGVETNTMDMIFTSKEGK